MIPTLISQLDEFVDIPSPEQLRNSRDLSKEEKLALWDTCKVLSMKIPSPSHLDSLIPKHSQN